eukprot:3308949-Prymnesium_polylepis.1
MVVWSRRNRGDLLPASERLDLQGAKNSYAASQNSNPAPGHSVSQRDNSHTRMLASVGGCVRRE